jgi:hypothetical protein
MTSLPSRSLVLGLYREILRHVKLLKPDRQSAALQEAKTAFRQHKNETDQEKIQKLIKEAENKLGFLRVITPKRGRITGSVSLSFFFGFYIKMLRIDRWMVKK